MSDDARLSEQVKPHAADFNRFVQVMPQPLCAQVCTNCSARCECRSPPRSECRGQSEVRDPNPVKCSLKMHSCAMERLAAARRRLSTHTNVELEKALSKAGAAIISLQGLASPQNARFVAHNTRSRLGCPWLATGCNPGSNDRPPCAPDSWKRPAVAGAGLDTLDCEPAHKALASCAKSPNGVSPLQIRSCCASRTPTQ